MSNIDIAILGVVLAAFLGFAGTLFYWSSRPPAQTTNKPPLTSRDSPRH
jgi:hypothetical protein